MLSKVLSSAVHGIDAYVVDVETNMEKSIPSFIDTAGFHFFRSF